MPNRDLAEHRHAELIEALRRINAGIELLNETADRQVRALASAEARLEAGLAFFIKAWQAARKQEGDQCTSS